MGAARSPLHTDARWTLPATLQFQDDGCWTDVHPLNFTDWWRPIEDGFRSKKRWTRSSRRNQRYQQVLTTGRRTVTPAHSHWRHQLHFRKNTKPVPSRIGMSHSWSSTLPILPNTTLPSLPSPSVPYTDWLTLSSASCRYLWAGTSLSLIHRSYCTYNFSVW